jgi:hypothetical protein
MARANGTNPTAIGNWTRQNVFKSDDPYRTFSGQHVAIKFDANGGLHVVCYRISNGDVLYLYAPDADGGAAYTFDYSVLVDEKGSVGTWTDISLDGTMPAISYINSSMIGTFDGIKYASPRNYKGTTTAAGTTTTAIASNLIGNTFISVGDTITFPTKSAADMKRTITGFDSITGTITFAALSGASGNSISFVVYKSDWEHEIIPANAQVTDARTSIEVKKGSASWGDTAIGYRSDRFELVYMKVEP